MDSTKIFNDALDGIKSCIKPEDIFNRTVDRLDQELRALRLQVKHQRAAFDALIGVGKLTDDEVDAALAFAESLDYGDLS